MQHSEKTVPYRLSPAELENLRLLRKRMNPPGSIQDDKEENKTSEEIDAQKSDRRQFDRKSEKKTS
jgi:hypothetical protein